VGVGSGASPANCKAERRANAAARAVVSRVVEAAEAASSHSHQGPLASGRGRPTVRSLGEPSRGLVCQEAALRPGRCLRPGEARGRGRVCSCTAAVGPRAEAVRLVLRRCRWGYKAPGRGVQRVPWEPGMGTIPHPRRIWDGVGMVPCCPLIHQIGDGDGGPSPSPDKSGMGTVALGSLCTEPDGEPERYSQPGPPPWLTDGVKPTYNLAPPFSHGFTDMTTGKDARRAHVKRSGRPGGHRAEPVAMA
jgi:hypothetical protein